MVAQVAQRRVEATLIADCQPAVEPAGQLRQAAGAVTGGG
jgi:hypothetical protein